jgi:hypothetical protein
MTNRGFIKHLNKDKTQFETEVTDFIKNHLNGCPQSARKPLSLWPHFFKMQKIICKSTEANGRFY